MNKTFAVSTTRWFLDRSQDDSSTFDSVTPPGLAKPMAEPGVAEVGKWNPICIDTDIGIGLDIDTDSDTHIDADIDVDELSLMLMLMLILLLIDWY